MLLRVLGFARVQSLVARVSASAPLRDTSDAAERARAAAQAVKRAARRIPGSANCLTTSLALWWLLRRHGIESELRIGSRLGGEDLEAHAWVESRGAVLNDTPDVHERFAAFERPVTPAKTRAE